MHHAVRYFWTHQRLVFVVFLASFLVFVWFGGGFVSRWIYFNDPAHIQQPLEPWMSPRYVGRSYDLPPEVIRPLMGLTDKETRSGMGGRPTMGKIALSQGITLDELESRVRDAAQAHQAKRGHAQ